MKKIIYSALLAIATIFTACDINDSMDKVVLVGNMAPQVYWEVGSSTISAGSNVPFTVQYYSTSTEAIDKLEVWYNLIEDESKTLSCPWVTTFTYSLVSNKSAQKRISQRISDYPHVLANWNDSLRAYSFMTTFPTSNTLSATTWVKPANYENEKMTAFIGPAFMKLFRDSLYKTMKALDFQKMYVGLNLVDNFKIYIDSTKNENTGGWTYHFPKDAQGNAPIPQVIADIYKDIPFSDLLFNKSTNTYDVEYVRSYKINAIMKVYDKKGVTGISLNSEISLN